MQRFYKFTEVYLISKNNRKLIDLAKQHKNDYYVVRDILSVLEGRDGTSKNSLKSKQAAIAEVQPIFDACPSPKKPKNTGKKTGIITTIILLLSAIFIGVFQGVGRDLWAHYSGAVLEILSGR